MGRFACTVEFYTRYRQPYPPKFSREVAEQIALRGDESLLDIGCGHSLLAMRIICWELHRSSIRNPCQELHLGKSYFLSRLTGDNAHNPPRSGSMHRTGVPSAPA
jgi:hypothetical protein